MKKVLGGKEQTCEFCKGTMIYLLIKGIGVVSQCRDCGAVIEGRAKEKIYSYEVESWQNIKR